MPVLFRPSLRRFPGEYRVPLALNGGLELKQKRAFPRWPVTLLGHYCRPNLQMEDGPSTFYRSPCLITDLNESGLGFVSDQEHEIGETLEMQWRLDAECTPIQVVCRVQHVKKRLAGVEFLNVALSDRLRIVDFVTRNLVH